MEEVKLVPSEGVGSGGAGHQTHSSVFRLPPPIPGIIGGGYPSEWHDAATRIQTSFRGHSARRKMKMEDVTLVETPAASEEVFQRARKRDMIMKVAANPMKYVKDVASKVAQNETVKSQVDRLQQATTNISQVTTEFVGQAKDRIGAVLKKEQTEGGVMDSADAVKDDRRGKYAGWILETVKTKGAAVFYLARRGTGSSEEAPFDVARKQPRMEVIDIAARTDLKTTFNVQAGDTLKWTMAIKSHDVSFKVMMRKMMDVGGSDDEELVPCIKVDSTSVGEGTYTVQESGTVVLIWDNGYSMMRSKTVAYRAWVERAGDAASAAPAAAQGAAPAPPAVQDDGAAQKQMEEEQAQAAKLRQQQEDADRAKLEKIAAEKRKAEDAEAAEKDRVRKEEEEAAAAAKAEEERVAAEKKEKARAEAERIKKKAAEQLAKREEEEKKAKEEKAAAAALEKEKAQEAAPEDDGKDGAGGGEE
mmetsp:Transcript_31816/g.76981  ORF Transcript_31816/g.76981 Transcript_31816/m.76981 type:complete len:474 (+) Transcript_31816:96-1517(+)